jgi:hypothetical protein
MFDGESLNRWGHSAHCVVLSEGTVVVSVFVECKKLSVHSTISDLCFYKWNPCHPNFLQSGLAPVGASLDLSSHLGLLCISLSVYERTCSMVG